MFHGPCQRHAVPLAAFFHLLGLLPQPELSELPPARRVHVEALLAAAVGAAAALLV